MKVTVLLLPVALAGACHYDWGVGPRAAEGADSGEADATAIETGTPDVGLDAANGEATAGQCEFYAESLRLLRPGLLPCTTTCAQSVNDECGCKIPVADANSAGAKQFSAAVATFKNAGCTANCQPCNPGRYACLSMDGGGICL
jgi:hypothetical protein